MKKISLYMGLLLCSLPLLLTAQDGYQIHVQVKNLQAEQAFLANFFGDKTYKSDSAKVEGEAFTFQGEEPLPQGLYLVYFSPEKYFELIIGEDQHFSLTTDTTNFVTHMQVDGSADNELFFSDLQFINKQRQRVQQINEQLKNTDQNSEAYKELQAQLEQINQEVISYREKMVAEHPEMLYPKILRTLKEPTIPDPPPGADSLYRFHYYRAHFFDEVDFNDQRLLRTRFLHQKADTYLERLTPKHPDSIIHAVDYIIGLTQDTLIFRYFVQTFLNKYAASKIMGMDAVYVHIVEKYYMTGRAYWVDEKTLHDMVERALAISPTLIGKKAPNFEMRDINGNLVSLYGIKAPYTILYFWDYDCGHCKKVTPKLVEAYEKYIDKGVQLITVSINGSIEVWKNKVGEYGIKGIPLADPARTSGFDRMYDVRSTPRLFLLDKDKIIKAKHITVEQMEELLDRFLEEDAGSSGE
ncbi:MAG: DUF5106 domain-containing protein [Bacteroidetes bacterium]|nr:MAG: DUF5106 domain-containing protein [Bacteroidota bacterium]